MVSIDHAVEAQRMLGQVLNYSKTDENTRALGRVRRTSSLPAMTTPAASTPTAA